MRLSNLASGLQPPGGYCRNWLERVRGRIPHPLPEKGVGWQDNIILTVTTALLITIITISCLSCFCSKTVRLERDEPLSDRLGVDGGGKEWTEEEATLWMTSRGHSRRGRECRDGGRDPPGSHRAVTRAQTPASGGKMI